MITQFLLHFNTIQISLFIFAGICLLFAFLLQIIRQYTIGLVNAYIRMLTKVPAEIKQYIYVKTLYTFNSFFTLISLFLQGNLRNVIRLKIIEEFYNYLDENEQKQKGSK